MGQGLVGDPSVRATAAAPSRLKKRRDFLHVGGGRKSHSGLFTVQTRSQAESAAGPRVGLTVTKKVGNAVERNRIKRRLREALRLDASSNFLMSHDYVIVARRSLLSVPFAEIAKGLRISVSKAHVVKRQSRS